MESLLEAIRLFTGLLVSCLFIGLVMTAGDSAVGVYQRFTKSYDSTTTSIQESTKTKYDGLVVTGSEVVSFIRKYQSTMCVSVTRKAKNGADMTPVLFEGTGQILNLPSDWNYVNPNASFVGSVVRNANDVMVAMNFAQQQAVTNGVPPDSSGVGGGDSGMGDSDVIAIFKDLSATLQAQTVILNEMATRMDALQLQMEKLLAGGTGGGDSTSPGNPDYSTQFNAITASMQEIKGVLVKLSEAVEAMKVKGTEGTVTGLSQVLTKMEELGGAASEVSLSLTRLSQIAPSKEDEQAVKELTNTLGEIVENIDQLEKEAIAAGETSTSREGEGS